MRYRAIWVASVARTGSMWVFNVVRDLVRATGREVRPETIPLSDEEKTRIGLAGALGSSDTTYVLKVHSLIPADIPNSGYVVTRRDVRDSMISYLRFMQVDLDAGFDLGLDFVANALATERHLKTLPREHTTVIEYQDIVSRPVVVGQRLAARLRLPVGRPTVEDIILRYTKERVHSRTVETIESLRRQIESHQPIDPQDMIVTGPNTVRPRDRHTGFQAGHVSNYQDGDWRKMLSPDQKDRLEAVIQANTPKRR